MNHLPAVVWMGVLMAGIVWIYFQKLTLFKKWYPTHLCQCVSWHCISASVVHLLHILRGTCTSHFPCVLSSLIEVFRDTSPLTDSMAKSGHRHVVKVIED